MKTAHDIAFMLIADAVIYTVACRYMRRNRKVARANMYDLALNMILRGLY